MSMHGGSSGGSTSIILSSREEAVPHVVAWYVPSRTHVSPLTFCTPKVPCTLAGIHTTPFDSNLALLLCFGVHFIKLFLFYYTN
jgi:hypothetical protein